MFKRKKVNPNAYRRDIGTTIPFGKNIPDIIVFNCGLLANVCEYQFTDKCKECGLNSPFWLNYDFTMDTSNYMEIKEHDSYFDLWWEAYGRALRRHGILWELPWRT